MSTTTTSKGRKATTTAPKAEAPEAASTEAAPAKVDTRTVTVITTAEARAKRVEAAAKAAEEAGGPVAIATEAVRAIVADEAATDAVKAAQDAKAEAHKAVAARLASLANLAAVLNPTLTAPTRGNTARGRAVGEVQRAVAEALGITGEAAQRQVQRGILAGSLILAHNMTPAKAYALAVEHSKAGTMAQAWAIVEAPVLPKVTDSTKGPKAPQAPKAPAKPITATEARKVIQQAREESLAKMTPEARGTAMVREVMAAYRVLVEAVEAGTAIVTPEARTTVESMLANLTKVQAPKA